jgi:hypothetical protein
VLVDKEAAPEVYNMRPEDMISVGPFEGTGLDTRSSGVLGMFRWVCPQSSGNLAPSSASLTGTCPCGLIVARGPAHPCALLCADTTTTHPTCVLLRFPTVVIFAAGTAGIAAASALISSPQGVSTCVSPKLRSDVRLYYNAPNR